MPNVAKMKNIFLLKEPVFVYILVLLLLIFTGCSNNGGSNSGKVNFEGLIPDDNDVLVMENQYYRIPAPTSLFIFMRQGGALYTTEFLNPFSNSSNYNTTAQCAMNFGVYTADLAYCAVNEDYQSSIIYYNAAKKQAEILGLYEGYGKEMAERIDKNLSNIDSLLNITGESYYAATGFLEEQGLADVFGLILAGGWVEALYLSLESVTDFEVQPDLVQQIADQQVLLDNLINYLAKHEQSDDIKRIKPGLEELQQIYDGLYFNDEETVLTKNQFVAIYNKVKSLRLSYIQ